MSCPRGQATSGLSLTLTLERRALTSWALEYRGGRRIGPKGRTGFACRSWPGNATERLQNRKRDRNLLRNEAEVMYADRMCSTTVPLRQA